MMSNFKVEHWWHALLLAGVAVLGVGAFAKDKAVVALAFGMVFLGLGVWANHFTANDIIFPAPGIRGHRKQQVFKATWFGMAMSVIGLALMAVGGWKLFLALIR